MYCKKLDMELFVLEVYMYICVCIMYCKKMNMELFVREMNSPDRLHIYINMSVYIYAPSIARRWI